MSPRWAILAGLVGCATVQTGVHRSEDLAAAPAMDSPAAVPAPEPASWNTSRIAGAGFRNTPHEVARVQLAGPVEQLYTDGVRFFARAGSAVQMVRSGKVVWTQPIAARALSLLADGVWVSRDQETARLDVGTGAVSERPTAGGELAAGVQALGESGRAWQTRDGTIHTSAGWFLPFADVIDPAGGRSTTGLTSSGAGIATDGAVVYAVSLDGLVIAADEKGERWRTALPASPVGAPVLAPGAVLVAIAAAEGEPGGVLALDRAGMPLWRARSPAPCLAPALGPDGNGGWSVYLANRSGELYAFDLTSGKPRWDLSFEGAVTAMRVEDDVVLVGSADGTLSAVESSDGGVRWHTQIGTVTASPVVVGGELWVGLADGGLVGLAE